MLVTVIGVTHLFSGEQCEVKEYIASVVNTAWRRSYLSLITVRFIIVYLVSCTDSIQQARVISDTQSIPLHVYKVADGAGR